MALALACVWPFAASAQPLTVNERLPLVQPRVQLLRDAIARSSAGVAKVDADQARAMAKAEKFWRAGQAQQALLALSPLQKYAPIAELPFVKAQLLMAAIAEEANQVELRNHHRAFATALVQAIGAERDGLSPATALKLVLPSEAEGWLISQRDRFQTLGKSDTPLQLGGKRYDRWQVRQRDGAERTLYFDVTTATRRGHAPAPRQVSRISPASGNSPAK